MSEETGKESKSQVSTEKEEKGQGACVDSDLQIESLNDMGLEIPHKRVRLEGGVLSTEQGQREFVKNMSHELRTPLNVIIGLCQVLERDKEVPLAPVQRDVIDRMARNARTLLQSVNHLLADLRTRQIDRGDH